MKKDIVSLYEEILNINIGINFLLSQDWNEENYPEFNEKFQTLAELKGEYIEKLSAIKNKYSEGFKQVLESELKEASGKINSLEAQNLFLLEEKKALLSTQIAKVSQSSKALGAYKFNREENPRIIDEKNV